MSDKSTKALEERLQQAEREIRELDGELQALSRTLVIVISSLAANNPDRLQFAERMRTLGDQAHMESKTSRRLLDSIADRIDTIGTPPPKEG